MQDTPSIRDLAHASAQARDLAPTRDGVLDPAAGPATDLAVDQVLDLALIKALASERRLAILGWLKDPRAHFPAQVDGDLVADGVCALFIAEKLGVSPATLSEHMRVLVQAGLVRPKRIRQWTFYKRDEARIRAAKAALAAGL